MTSKLLGIVAVLFLLVPATSFGQGSLRVTVQDAASNDRIAGANVCLKDDGNIVAEMVTGDTGGDRGRVVFEQVADGDYRLVADAAGYVGTGSMVSINGDSQNQTLSLAAGNPDDGEKCAPSDGIPYPPEDPSIYVPPGPIDDDTLGNPNLPVIDVSEPPPQPDPDPPESQLYPIEAGLAYDYARSQGWRFDDYGGFWGFSACHIWSSPGYEVTDAEETIVLLEARRSLLGWFGGTTHCTFVLFGDRQLNDGWTFESYTIHLGQDIPDDFADGCVDFGAEPGGAQITQQPEQGDTEIQLGLMITSDKSCRAQVESITLRGPYGQPWTEAFSQ